MMSFHHFPCSWISLETRSPPYQGRASCWGSITDYWNARASPWSCWTTASGRTAWMSWFMPSSRTGSRAITENSASCRLTWQTKPTCPTVRKAVWKSWMMTSAQTASARATSARNLEKDISIAKSAYSLCVSTATEGTENVRNVAKRKSDLKICLL